jgi:two-component system, chemotaxis family, CheB/CheR fusion protein
VSTSRTDIDAGDVASAEVLGSILDTVDVPIIVVARDCNMSRFNLAAAEALGVSSLDVGRHLSHIASLADASGIDQECARVMHDGLPSRREIRLGERRFMVHIAPLSSGDGSTRGGVLTFTNVTAFRASIEQAIYEREYTKTIVNAVLMPLVVLDDSLRVQTANRAFFDWFGVPREKAQGMHLSDLGDWSTSELVAASLKATLEGREFRTVEFEGDFHKAGRRTVLLDACRLPSNKSALVLLSFRDITARKALEIQRELLLAQEATLRREAEAAVRAKDRFLAALSHELRTPLSPVLLAASALDEHPDLAPALREKVATIRRNVELEVRLIDDLLDLNRVTSGKMHLEMQPTRLHVALTLALQTCEGEVASKKLNVHLDLQAKDDVVNADPVRLQQVFWNVLRNAAKFTPEGGDIFVRSENVGDAVRVEVRDTGVGIAANVLPKVFDAFEQGDINTARQFGGLGLGLAICDSIVKLHAGAIRAESEGVDRGATFVIEFPMPSVQQVAAAASRHDNRRQEVAAAAPRVDGQIVRVLLVEDHEDSRELLADLLGARNFAVKTASSIAAALQLAASERFDVVISDLGLPDGTGWDLMKQLRDRHALKGIALSGFGMEADHQRSREAGFCDHVIKPVNPTRLVEVLQRVAASQVVS